MKNKVLLPIVLLLGMALTGCIGAQKTTPGSESNSEQQQSESESPSDSQSSDSHSESDPTVYGVAITNKDELTADWYEGDSSRSLAIELTPAGNVLKAIADGELVITSSDSAIVNVTGLGLGAVGEGKATITAAYHGEQDSVEITVLHKQTIKEKYDIDHEGTAEDPLTNEEALKVAKAENYGGEDLYVGGTIASFYHAPGSRTDGAVSWFLKPAEGQTEKFEIYKCYKEGTGAASYLTDDDVWVNGYAIAHGKFTVYNGQYETSAALFHSCEGNKPQPRKTITATFAEVLEVNAALADGADSYDYYQFDAYVTKQEGKNYFLTATKGEEIVSAKSDADHGERDYYSNAFEIYGASDDLAALLLKDAKVTVTSIVKNYHGQAENLLALTTADVTVVEAGLPWVIPNHEVTVAEALTTVAGLTDGQTTVDTYELKDVYVKEVTGAYSAEFGNMNFTVVDAMEDTDVLTVFRAKTDAETAAKVVAGAQVTIKGNLQKYVKNDVTTPELLNVASITVKDSGEGGGGEEETVVTFDVTDYAAEVSAVSGTTKFSTITLNEVVTISVSGTDANTGKMYGPGNTTGLWEVRCYKSGSATLNITVASGYKLVSASGVIASANWAAGSETELAISDNAVSFNNSNANFNFKSLKVEYAAEGGEEQQEIAQPIGNFSGHAIAADDSNIFVVMALGQEDAYLEVGTIAKEQVKYTFDNTTGKVSLTSGTLGAISAIYDEANNQLTTVTLENEAAAAYVKNNGEITLSSATCFWDCNGTTEELQSTFKRRYGDPWTVDTTNADRLTSYENGIAGSAMKVRAWNGGRYALNLNEDMEATAFKNIGFWVYNSGEQDVTINIFVYQGAGFTNFANPGSVTAKAGQWTYCRMGFNHTIMNFQLLDNTKIGTALVYDNIALY